MPDVQLDATQSNSQTPQEAPQIAQEDRYRNSSTSLIEKADLNMLDYHKKLVGNRKEVYAKGVHHLLEEYNQNFQEKERSRAVLPLTFIEPSDLLVKNAKFQKGKKRLPTGREAAEWEERAVLKRLLERPIDWARLLDKISSIWAGPI